MAQDFPRPELVRRQQRDGARYFGPYKGATAVREVLDVVRMVFPVRTCTRAIDPGRPRRPCVHHEIGQCLAPCAGKVTREAYHEVLEKVVEFLSAATSRCCATCARAWTRPRAPSTTSAPPSTATASARWRP